MGIGAPKSLFKESKMLLRRRFFFDGLCFEIVCREYFNLCKVGWLNGQLWSKYEDPHAHNSFYGESIFFYKLKQLDGVVSVSVVSLK